LDGGIWLLMILPIMLQKLRNLNDESKKKVIIFLSFFFSFGVFVFWFFHFFSIFTLAFNEAELKGSTALASLKQNVAEAYDGFQKIIPKELMGNVDSTTKIEEEVSTTTEDVLYNSQQDTNNLIVN
jgi:hypothetical protein